MKDCQSAFLKLTYTLFSLLSGMMVVEQEMMSGKWSDPSSVLGSHDMYGRRDMLAREMSGDVG